MKQIEEFPDYYVTENGEVWSNKYHPNKNKNCELRKLKPQLHKCGYLMVHLYENGKKYIKKIHRLVALTLIPNPNNYKTVNHINGIKTDNRIENLEWCTSSYNNKHAIDMGLRKVSSLKGEKHGCSKLTEQQVIQIRQKYKTGKYRQKQLGEEYGVCRDVIDGIVNYRSWKHI